MDAKELHDLVKGHGDVWGDKLHFDFDQWTYDEVGTIPDSLAEAALIGLFAVATGCGVSYNHQTDPSVNDGDEPLWFTHDGCCDIWSHSQPSRLEALVRAREAQKERGA